MKDDSLADSGQLRIAVLGSTYPRAADDHEVPWLRESVKRLAARGHKVTVIAPAYHALKDHKIDGVEVRRFRYAPARWEMLTHGEGAPNKLKKYPILKLLTLTYIFGGIVAVWKICRQERIDILHVHWPFPHGLMALLPAWLSDVKVVSSCHSAEFALAAKNKLSTSLLALSLRKSDIITANSTYTANLVSGVAQRKAEIIPWGATVKVEPSARPAAQTIPLLLFSGRLIERKGVNFLLREELSSLFRSCSVYVHPAIYDSRGDTEGLGVVLVEALSNRKPVVASRVGGIVDVIKDGETGLLVPEKDPEAIAKTVLRLLENPDYAQRLGEQGCAYATDYFNWDRIIDQYEAIYRKCVLADRERALEEKNAQPVTT